MQIFIDALAMNRTLLTLKLNANNISRKDKRELARVATQSDVLTRLEVEHKNLIASGDVRPSR